VTPTGRQHTLPGPSTLFSAAFRQSKNAMVLVDADRRLVDVNGAFVRLIGHEHKALIGEPVYRFIAGGPVLTPAEWRAALKAGQCTGKAEVVCADDGRVSAQWAGTSEVVTGRQLTLVVVLSTSRWGAHFRRSAPNPESRALSAREREVVRLVALGYTSPEIADHLQIAHDTARTHARNAMAKVDARSRAHLVAKALGEGLV
jgi:DNA-binding CsgD family transcriptional regulator